jgi:hypothetical protein
MHGPINVKSSNNTSKWRMGFNSAFKGLTEQWSTHVVRRVIQLFNVRNTATARNLSPFDGSVGRSNELAECSTAVRPRSSRKGHYGGYGVLTETE